LLLLVGLQRGANSSANALEAAKQTYEAGYKVSTEQLNGETWKKIQALFGPFFSHDKLALAQHHNRK
jgi:hypothetical protein